MSSKSTNDKESIDEVTRTEAIDQWAEEKMVVEFKGGRRAAKQALGLAGTRETITGCTAHRHESPTGPWLVVVIEDQVALRQFRKGLWNVARAHDESFQPLQASRTMTRLSRIPKRYTIGKH